MENEITVCTEPSSTDRMLASLKIKAAASGCDISDLKIEYVTLERTWGDKDGMVFIGQNAERCAKFAAAWLAKNGNHNYDGQNCASYLGVMTVGIGSGKPEWSSNPYRQVTGHTISTFYYPCAD